MYNRITTEDLLIRIRAINELLNSSFSLEYWPNVMNPYRLLDENGNRIHSGSKKDLYRYLIGVLEGINSYKQAHNI